MDTEDEYKIWYLRITKIHIFKLQIFKIHIFKSI
jgi:hypothetical protein